MLYSHHFTSLKLTIPLAFKFAHDIRHFLINRVRDGGDGDMDVECPVAYAEKIMALAFDATVSIAALPEASGPAQLGVDDSTRELALGLHAELLGAVRLRPGQ